MSNDSTKNLFLDALELPPAERSAFLGRACGNNEPLRRVVEALLAAHDVDDTRLGAADWSIDTRVLETDAPNPRDVAPGDVVGGYVLERKLGEGGFGVVYLARQEQPVSRQVAFKVLKLGMDSREVLARFAAERRVLALMEHPGVARILDAGSTPHGRPYFVMEYFDGIPITTFTREQSATVPERLELFLQACTAIQHAHNRGIIHRDLKPSNVLVGRVDGEPTVKVIDFGVAKALERPLLDGSLMTMHGGVLGTPAYMSPEQASGNLDVDIRSDVYMLGTLLYELLAGCAPFSADQALDELLRQVRETDPRRPSTVLRRAGERARDVPADLDLIVLRCLEKDRDRRYPTAESLAADVKRYLDGRPVDAAPPGALYRMRKLARRHRVAFVSAVLVLLSTIAGVAGLTAGLVAASDARERLSAAYAQAQEEAEHARVAEATAREQSQVAEEVIFFLTNDVLANVNPSYEQGHGRDVTLREVLDEAARKVRGESDDGWLFDHAPEVRARLNAAIGGSYENLGEFQAAEEHLRQAFEYFDERYGLEHSDTLIVGSRLANLYTLLDRVDDADALFARVVEHPDALLEVANDYAFATLRRLAMLRFQQGRHAEATQIIEATLAGVGEASGVESEGYLMIATSAAILRDKLGDSTGAGELFEHVYRTHLGREGPLGPSTLMDGVNYGSFLYKRGRLEEARTLLDRTLAGNRQLYGTHPNTVAAMTNLGLTLCELGEFDAAADLFYEAHDVNVALLGPDHPTTLKAEGRIASLLWDRGEQEESIALRTDLLERARAALGPEAFVTLTQRTDWIAARISIEAEDELMPELVDLLAVKRRVLGELHPSTLTTHVHLASYHDLRQELEEAEREYLAAVESYETAFGRQGADTIRTLADYAGFLRRNGRHEEAVEHYRDVVDRGHATFGRGSVIQTFHELGLGESLAAAGDPEAAALLRSVHERTSRRDPGGGEAGIALRAARALAGVHAEAGDDELAAHWDERTRALASR